MAPSLAVILLVLSISATGISRLSGGRDVPRLGFVGQSLAFVAASGVTAVAFALAPAGIIHVKTQAWALTCLIIAAIAALVCWAVWSWLDAGLSASVSVRCW